MGKKRIIKKTEEELIKEKERLDSSIKKASTTTKATNVSKDGRIYVFSSYNNTILTLTDLGGNVLFTTSAGRLGFKGPKKATPFAASKVADNMIQAINKLGINKLEIFVKGIGGGRESAVRSLVSRGLEIVLIKDVTPIPHNGCRPRKPRRV